MERTSDKLRVVSRAMPLAFPPLEGFALCVLMLVWLLGG